MPSPENPSFENNSSPAAPGESAGETSRQTYEARGEKTLNSEYEQRRKELLEERARLVQERDLLNKRIAKNRQILGISSEEDLAQTGQTQVEQTEVQQTGSSPAPMEEPGSPVETPAQSAETPAQPTEESGLLTEAPVASTQPVIDTTQNPNPTSHTEQPVVTPQQTTANAPQTASAPEVAPAGIEPERPTEQEISQTINKGKNKRSLKAVLAGAAAVAIAALSTIGIFAAGNNSNAKNHTPSQTTSVTEVMNDDEKYEISIHDGYGEKGMWSSSNKGGAYDFSCAKEVAEVCDNDECEMIKYTAHNQVESYADYLANLPEALQPEGFKGLTILETEKKLESLSKEEYKNITQQFDQIIDGAFTRRVVVNGEQSNAYMRLKDASKGATHDNMELVACTTNENNLEVTQFYWVDDNGNEIGTMTVKMTPIYDENDNIIGYNGCEQVLGGGSQVYTDMKVIPPSPTDPTQPDTTPDTTPDTPPETTTETIKPKDPDNLTRIDNQINEDIAEDIGTDEINITPNPGVSEDELTDKPSSDAYQGTEAEIVQNDASKEAEDVQGQVSPENNYSEDRGGAHQGEYAPVQEDQAGQEAADANRISNEELPNSSSPESSDILGDLGIN